MCPRTPRSQRPGPSPSRHHDSTDGIKAKPRHSVSFGALNWCWAATFTCTGAPIPLPSSRAKSPRTAGQGVREGRGRGQDRGSLPGRPLSPGSRRGSVCRAGASHRTIATKLSQGTVPRERFVRAPPNDCHQGILGFMAKRVVRSPKTTIGKTKKTAPINLKGRPAGVGRLPSRERKTVLAIARVLAGK